jgi:glycosyltransferase involved in cell wall biosynthesis
MNNYVIITAVKNEERLIDYTCKSMIDQKKLPLEWIIVDDSSEDNSLIILREYASKYPFIKVFQYKKNKKRDFSSQVFAQMYGYKKISCNNYAYIGFLDGDLRFDRDYYCRLLKAMEHDCDLGIVGGEILDIFSRRNKDIRRGSEDYSVPGGVQFFRRQCFEQLNGYMPISVGGQDTVAGIAAMMRGWKVKTIRGLVVEHLKPEVKIRNSQIKANLNFAKQAYLLGYNPIFFIMACLRRIFDPPIIATCLFRIGFFYCLTAFCYKRPVDVAFIKKIREIQVAKMKSFIRNLLYQ